MARERKAAMAIRTETREVAPFTRLDFAGVGELTVVQGEREALVIEADDEVLSEIRTEVRGDTLHIGYKPVGILKMLFQAGKPIRIAVTAVTIVEISDSGAGNLQSPGISGQRLTLTTSGVGNINIERITADELDVAISGTGSVTVAGKARQQRLSASGVGSYRASDLESDVATVTITGTGSALMWINEILDARLSGVGSLEYYGEPRISQRVSGIGRIHGRGVRASIVDGG
jgi:hypothetical protein